MKLAAFVVFALVLSGHFFSATEDTAAPREGSPWASYEFTGPDQSRLASYLESGDYWLGLSYALAGAFATWCFARILKLRREALAASAGGLTLSGVLLAGVCFFTGCCGSPMLPIYLGLLGPNFLAVTKPLTFGITLLSVLVGYAWMLKRAPKAITKNVNASLHEDVGADPGKV